MKKKINNKGFTLIELLAIIAITAIILGVGTYGIIDLVNKSKEKSSLISETSIKESASLYADEAGDSLWVDPGNGDYKYYCVTIDELINKGIIKKNAKLPKGIDKYNYVSVKKNKVTFVKGESLIIKDALDGSADANACVGNIIKEEIKSAPKEKNVTSYTDEIVSVFDDLVGESKIIDKTCYFNKDSSSIARDDEHKGDFDKSSNTCSIKGLDDETIYYYKTCMTTEKGSIICSDSYSTSTASFVSPEFSTKDDTITIKYKDDNVKEPYHYFKSNVDGTSDKNVSECVLGSDNKFTCSGSTSNITKDKWYKVNENEVKITYKDNEIKNGDITARIMDGTGNYKDNDKKFNLYRIVFKKGNADKINNGTNDITNICLNDIDKKCSIKSPSISKDGYTIVGWNTDSSASDSIWKVNTSKDIDGSNTYYPIIKSRVNIKLNANGGSVTKETSKGGTYTTDSSGIISRNGKDIFHTINYGEKMNSSGLANYNNKDYLYITRNDAIVTKNKEWICLSGCTTSGKEYSQYEAYSSDDFCDAKDKSCTVVLGVNWKTKNYTLIYDNNGGSGCTSKSITYDEEYGTLCTPSRSGYAFVGWFDSNYKDSPLNYYADTYSDLKNAFGYDANLLYKHYFEYGLKEGRRISQYISSDKYNTEGNKTIYAGWKSVVYKINYNANGGSGTMESDNAEFGTNVTIKSNSFTRDGYTFAGWTTKSDGTDDGYGWTNWSGTWNYVDGQNGIAENKLELYARWKKNNVYIKLNANGGSVTKETSEGGSYTTDSSGIISRKGNNIFHTIGYGGNLGSDGLANYNNKDWLYITLTGFTTNKNQEWICLSGCTTSGKVYSQYEAYSSDDFCDAKEKSCTVVLGVNWKNENYTLTYDNNGGSGCTSKSINYGDEYGTLCTPSKRGYAFVGWFDNNYKNSPLNYYADTYSDLKESFGYDANLLYKHYFEYGLKEGRRISQYISSDKYNTEGNKTIYAGWKSVVYKINYNANGGSGTMESDNAEFGTNVTIKSNSFTRDGYTFAGWTTKSDGTDDGYGWTNWSGTWNYVDGQNGIAENKLELYARWKKNNVYIKLNANGGSVTKETSEGGSYTTDSSGIISRKGNNIFHTIGYGGNLGSDGLANYNNKDWLYITLTGFTTNKNQEWICLSGCTTSGKVYSQYEAYSSGDFCDAKDKSCTVVLGVNWIGKQYTISYNANGGTGTMPSDNVSTNGNVTIKSNTFSRVGYTFAGWTTKSDGTDDGYGWTNWSGTWNYDNGQYGIAENKLELYAMWKRNTYTISYNPGYTDKNTCYNMCKSEKDQVSCGDRCDESAEPYDAGKMDSDTVSSGSSVTIKNNTFVRNSYTFAGWTTNSDGTDDGYGWTGWSGTWNYDNGQYGINNNRLVLYARWNIKAYTISYNANDGSNAPGNQSKIENKSINLSSSKPTRTGYTFVNWNTKKDGSGTTYKAGASYNSNADLTLYAQWRINKVYIKLDANGGSVRSSTTYGDCSTSNNLINCSWNKPDGEVFHTIDYGDSLDSAGLANYNNPDYLYITKDGYFAYASESWICDSSSGCSTVGKTFDQDTAYKASDFCDASGGDCTVTLKVNWKTINKAINDWRCHDKYSYFITYCEPNYMCEYTKIAYKENGKSYVKYVNGKIDSSTSLNNSSCYTDAKNGYRCNADGKYKITVCSETTCKYTEFNGSSTSGTVDRDTLKECAPDTKTMYVTSSNGVNCRYGAGTSYGIAVAYSCGAALTVNVNATNGWYYVTNDGCYSVGSALSSSKPSSCAGSSGGGTSGGCNKIIRCLTSAGSDAQCRSKISSLGGYYNGYNGKGDCMGKFCRSSCPDHTVEVNGW